MGGHLLDGPVKYSLIGVGDKPPGRLHCFDGECRLYAGHQRVIKGYSDNDRRGAIIEPGGQSKPVSA